MQRFDHTPGKSARAFCLFLEAVGKVCHTRIAQMGNEARSVADGYQNRRRRRVLDLDPVVGAAGAVWRTESLRYDTFAAERTRAFVLIPGAARLPPSARVMTQGRR